MSSEIQIPPDDIQWSFVRSSGPGGQNVNKVSSKAVLRWNVRSSGILDDDALERLESLHPSLLTKEGDLLITSQRTRDALKNREDCLDKLNSIILEALKKPKKRIPTRPTKGSIERRITDKKRNAQKKEGRKFDE